MRVLLSSIFILILPAGLRAGDDGFVVELPALESGDANGDWSIDLSDPVYLLEYLFLDGPAPVPVLCGLEVTEAPNGDVNGDGTLDISDAVRLLGHLYLGGPPPVHACGPDGPGGEILREEASGFMVYDLGGSPPEMRWVDEQGTLHQRNAIGLATVSGDFNGTARTVDSLNVHPSTGSGDLFGSFLLEVAWEGRVGTWEGLYSGTIVGGLGSGHFVGQGAGGLEGTLFLGTFQQTGAGPDRFLIENTVLVRP